MTIAARVCHECGENLGHVCRTRGMSSALGMGYGVSDDTKRLKWMTEQVRSLFEVIKHGDEKHQRWLEEAIANHFRRDSTNGDVKEDVSKIRRYCLNMRCSNSNSYFEDLECPQCKVPVTKVGH